MDEGDAAPERPDAVAHPQVARDSAADVPGCGHAEPRTPGVSLQACRRSHRRRAARASGCRSRQASAHGQRPHLLTRREREIAALIGEGLTSKQIATRLVIAERTVDSHAEHIREKLGLHSRAQIAAWAVDQGIVDHLPG